MKKIEIAIRVKIMEKVFIMMHTEIREGVVGVLRGFECNTTFQGGFTLWVQPVQQQTTKINQTQIIRNSIYLNYKNLKRFKDKSSSALFLTRAVRLYT